MSSETIARWSMPRVFMAGSFQKNRLIPLVERRNQLARAVARDVMARVWDFHDLQPRVGGLHLLDRPGGVHVGACAAQRKDRAAHLAEELPHVDRELRTLAALERAPELVAKIEVALRRPARVGFPEVDLEARAIALPEVG